jgi:transcription elongation factor Elf1
MTKNMNQSKKFYCKICKRELLPRNSLEENPKKPRVSLHHIDYQKNIAIRVCKECHNKLHTTMKKHKYGLNNVIRRDGSKKGRLPPGKYPEKILE